MRKTNEQLSRCIGMVVMVLLLLTGMASCKPSLPRDILSKGKMTDILYDYHIALAMAQADGDNGKSIAYKEAVLKKHGISEADFDSSMVYYMRHTELMHDVYKDLADRLNDEVVALGGSGSNGEFDNLAATGDTANVWKLSQSMIFSTFKPFNNASFEVKVDTAFHKGDRLMLDFDAQFIYQDGMRDGVALLAVQFKNDSVAQQVAHVQSSQHYSVEISDDQNLGIKSVKGYFLLSDGDFAMDMGSQTTLKLMFIEHIKLIRMHQPKTAAPKPGASGDSLKVDSTARPGMPPSGPTSSPSGGPTSSSSGGPSSSPSSGPQPLPQPGPRPGGPRPQLPKEMHPIDAKPLPMKVR